MLLRALSLCLLFATGSFQQHSPNRIITCEIDGVIDNEIHQLHGALQNCKSPEMECYIDDHEYLIKGRTNIHCRVESEDLFFNDDKLCSFRFYYRRSFCDDQDHCYSMTLTCEDDKNMTWILQLCIAGVTVVVLLFIGACILCVWCLCKRCCVKQKKLEIKDEITKSELELLKKIRAEKSPNDYELQRLPEITPPSLPRPRAVPNEYIQMETRI